MGTVAALTPNQSDALTSLRAFLLDVLPDGTDVVTGLQNRVAEPDGENFVVMSPTRITRLGTNREGGFFDVKFTGSVAGTTLTVTTIRHGVIPVGRFLFGVGVLQPTKISLQLTGAPGGIGTYQLGRNNLSLSSRTLAAGYWKYTQPGEMAVQLDFHSADLSASDNAIVVSTLFRSEYGVRFFKALPPDVIPLYADDPSQQPFVNDQQQYEWRWVLSACMQVNDLVQVGQEYADSVNIGLIEIDSHYPP